MAIYNEILSGRFGKLSQKLFSMKGEQAVKQLSGELMLVQNLPFNPEHRFLLQENRFSAVLNVVGAAAQFAGFRLRNPAKSNVMGVVESLTVGNSSTGQTFSIDISGPTPLDLTSSVFGNRLDSRIGSTVNIKPSLSVSQQTTLVSAVTGQVAIFPLVQFGFLQAVVTEDQELTVGPGDALTVGNGNAAASLIIGIIWRERPLEESELFQ